LIVLGTLVNLKILNSRKHYPRKLHKPRNLSDKIYNEMEMDLDISGKSAAFSRKMSACQLCHYEVKGNGAKNNAKAKYSYHMANESQVKI